WFRNCFAPRGRHAVDEETALGDHTIAWGKTLEHLDHVAAGEPDFDAPQLDRLFVVFLAHHPNAGGIPLVDNGVAGDRDRVVAFAGEDLYAGEHFRLEQSAGIIDGRAHQQPPGRRIERRGHVGDLGRERAVGIGEHGKVDLLADAHDRRFGLADIGDDPDGGQIADDEDRVGLTAADILPRPDLALHNRPRDRGGNQRGRIDRSLLLEISDLLIGLAENAQPVARRLQRNFGGAKVIFRGFERGARVLHLFEGYRLSLIEQALTLFDDFGQVLRRARLVQGRGSRNKIFLSLHHAGPV